MEWEVEVQMQLLLELVMMVQMHISHNESLFVNPTALPF